MPTPGEQRLLQRSTASGPSGAPAPNGSPNASRPASPRRSPPTLRTRRSMSPGRSPNGSGPPTSRRTSLRAGGSPSSCSSPWRPARSPESLASAGPCAGGPRRSGLIQHRPGQQRRHRSREWAHRTPRPHRQRLHQPVQLPAAHAPHRRRLEVPAPQVRRAGKRCRAGMLQSDANRARQATLAI
jgi:hypothetical protein